MGTDHDKFMADLEMSLVGPSEMGIRINFCRPFLNLRISRDVASEVRRMSGKISTYPRQATELECIQLRS
jgi:hypothetical protein